MVPKEHGISFLQHLLCFVNIIEQYISVWMQAVIYVARSDICNMLRNDPGYASTGFCTSERNALLPLSFLAGADLLILMENGDGVASQ